MDYSQYMQRALPVGEAGFHYELKSGSNLSRAIRDLANAGIINKPRYVRFSARLAGKATQIHAGEYIIKPGMSAQEFLDMLYSGKVVQYALTLVEGWNFTQLMDAVNSHPHLEHSLTGLSDSEIMQKLGYANEYPEGRFLPDTYHFPKGMSDVAFLQRAYKAMHALLEAEWQQREVGLPYNTAYEALIMASIVEKETGLPSERREIAGVFIRRLEKRMRLQTDPTVIYGMGERYKGNIRKRDLLRDTPYNTYTRSGLPPTPIAMPGKDAIYAALHPDESENLYFVARGDGSHHFSATLKEHNQAVIKYQLKGRKRPFSSFKP